MCLYVSKSHDSGTQHLRRVVVDSKEKNVDDMHFGRDKTYCSRGCNFLEQAYVPRTRTSTYNL